MRQLAGVLDAHREEIMQRFEARLRLGLANEEATRTAPRDGPPPEEATRSELRDGLPGYLALLARLLRSAAAPAAAPAAAVDDACADVAEEHGGQRLRLGFDPGSVVREYGYLRDCIFQVAEESGLAPSAVAAREIMGHIDLASSQAVAHYVRLRDEQLRQQAARHLSFLAHELRNPLNAALLAVDLLSSQAAFSGSRAAAALHRSLDRLRDLVDGSLTSGMLDAGIAIERAPISLTTLLTETVAESDIYARTKDIRFVLDLQEGLVVDGDARLLRSAISNLVRNAVKFTAHGAITIRAERRGAMARVEVEDCCGGLPPGRAASLFDPYVQAGSDRSGFGLGLAITRQAVLAHGGEVLVRDLPGQGCIFGFEVPLATDGPAAH